MTSNITTRLQINSLILNLHLGWTKEEKITRQRVLLDLDLRFATPPDACQSDKLDDTLCYAKLLETIRNKLDSVRISLVEHLAKYIYDQIKMLAPRQSLLQVRVTKYPRIDKLMGGVCFTYGDKEYE